MTVKLESEQQGRKIRVNSLRSLRPFRIKFVLLLSVLIIGCIILFLQARFSESYEAERQHKNSQLTNKRENFERNQIEFAKIQDNYDSVYRPLIEKGYISVKRRLDLVSIIEKQKHGYLFSDLEYRFDKDREIPLDKNTQQDFNSRLYDEDPMPIADSPPSLVNPSDITNKPPATIGIKNGRFFSATPITLRFGLFDLKDLVNFIEIISAQAPGQLVLTEWYIKRSDDVDSALQNTLSQFNAREFRMTPPLSVILKFDWNVVIEQDSGAPGGM